MRTQDSASNSVWRSGALSRIDQIRLRMTERGDDLAGGGRVDLDRRSTDGEKVSTRASEAVQRKPEYLAPSILGSQWRHPARRRLRQVLPRPRNLICDLRRVCSSSLLCYFLALVSAKPDAFLRLWEGYVFGLPCLLLLGLYWGGRTRPDNGNGHSGRAEARSVRKKCTCSNRRRRRKMSAHYW